MDCVIASRDDGEGSPAHVRWGFLAALGMTLLAACHSAAPPADHEGTLKFRVVKSGDRAAYQDQGRQIFYAPTAEVYDRLWNTIVGAGDPPPIDFTREAAVIIAAGQRPTGGFKVEVKNVALDGRKLVVDAPVSGPPADAMVIQVLTSPWAVVAIDKADVGEVEWK